MRIKLGSGLLPLNILVVLLVIAIIFFPSSVLRIIIGIPLLLLFPGYTLMAALFPKQRQVSGIERLALSVGLSIATVPLIGLILNYTPLGIRLETVVYSVASFIFIMSVIAWFRRKRLQEEYFGIEFQLKVPLQGLDMWDKVLSIILVVAILGALGTLGYVVAMPKVGERFTEFYILGLSGSAVDYPKELVVGEEGRVTVGISNQEHQIVSYRIEVSINDVMTNELGPIVLEHGEKWEQVVNFAPKMAGKKQRVEFLLYKNGEAKPYLEPLRLWVDVKQ